SRDLEAVTVPETETLVELISSRALLQLMTHDVARAGKSVGLLAPADAYPLLAPALRRPYAAGVALHLASTSPVELAFATVDQISPDAEAWSGMPVILWVDDRRARLG